MYELLDESRTLALKDLIDFTSLSYNPPKLTGEINELVLFIFFTIISYFIYISYLRGSLSAWWMSNDP